MGLIVHVVTYSAHVLDHVMETVSIWVACVPDSEVTGSSVPVTGPGGVIAWGPSPVHADYVIGVYPRKTR